MFGITRTPTIQWVEKLAKSTAGIERLTRTPTIQPLKIHRNRKIFILILILQKVTQHIFIELMDKVTIHAEEKMELQDKRVAQHRSDDIGRQEQEREK
jgi:hypothetical protein